MPDSLRSHPQSPQPRSSSHPGSQPQNLVCDIRLLDERRLQLEIDGMVIDGEHTVDPALRDEMAPMADPQQAGSMLFDALLPEGDAPLEAYRKITTEFRLEGRRQEVRLHIAPQAPSWLHGMPWELLFDPRRRLGLGCSHEISFLRAVPSQPTALPAVVGRLRLLVAVAGPSDVLHHNLPALDRRFQERALLASLRRLQDLLACEVLRGPVTPETLHRRLSEGEFHALHLVTHGRRAPHQEATSVFLEQNRPFTEGQDAAETDSPATGSAGQWVEAEQLREALCGHSSLRLVTLVACHDGIATRAEPFTGLGPMLAGQAAPAVVLTRRALTVSQAAKMAGHLYRGLALSGRIDEAVNEARERLFHSRADQRTWASPTAYLGGEPLIWHSEETRRRQVEEDTQALEMAQFRLEQQKRDEMAARAEAPPPPPRANQRNGLRLAAAGLLVTIAALVTAGGLGRGPLAGWWRPPQVIGLSEPAQDLRPQDSIDPEATRRAIPRYASACETGNALACARLAAIYELGRGVRPDPARGEGYYRMACELGDPASCYHLGRLLESQLDWRQALSTTARDRVLALYEKACAGAEPRGCRRLSVLNQDVPEEIAGKRPTDLQPQAAGGFKDPTGGDSTGSSRQAEERDPSAGAQSDLADTGATAVSEPAGTAEALVDGRVARVPRVPRGLQVEGSHEGNRWIYELAGSHQGEAQAAQARGNVYRVGIETQLLAWDVWLDFDDQQDLTFSVHVADEDLGSFTSVFSRNLTVQGRGPGWYSSGETELVLEADRSYLVAVSWNGVTAYAFDIGPQETYFAQLSHGHVDLHPILPEVESELADGAGYRQRLIVEHPLVIDGAEPAEPPILADQSLRTWVADPESTDGPQGLELGLVDRAEIGATGLSDGAAEGAAEAADRTLGRGNLTYIHKSVTLRGVDLWLEHNTPLPLRVTVFRADERSGPFESAAEVAWTAEPAAGWTSSPDIDLELEPGNYYWVVGSWSGNATYRFTPSAPQEWSHGRVLAGAAGAEPPITSDAWKSDRALYSQRWRLGDP